MKTLRVILTLVSCISFCSGASALTCGAGTKQWTGNAGDNLWTTTSNWSGSTVPISSDNVCIASTFSANTITIPNLDASNQIINKLQTGAAISFSGGPLTISGAATFNTLSVGSGTLTLNGSSSASILNLNGGALTGTSTLTVTGLTTWGTATMSGTGITNANGGINMPPSEPTLDARTVNVGGTSTFGTGAGSALFLMQNGGTLNVQAGAVWNIVNDGEIRNTGGTTPVINNAGTFEKTAGTGTTNIGAGFNNNTGGTVAGNSGTLSLNGGGSGVGTYSMGSGAKLAFGGGTTDLNSGATFTGAGTVVISGGAAVNFNSGAKISAALETDGGTTTLATGHTDTIAVLTLNGGTLTGTSTLTVTGLTTWGSATMSGAGITNANGGINILPSEPTLDTRTVNVGGTSTFGTAAAAPLFLMQNGGTLNVQAGAVWNIVNDGEIRNTGGTTPVINNAGTFEKTAGTETTNIGAAFNNNTGGTVAGNSGTLSLNGGGSGVGTYSMGSGGKLAFGAGTFALNAGTKISGAGTAAISGGTVNLNSGARISSALEVNSGTVALSTGHTDTIAALTLNAGTLTGTSTLTVTGLTTWGTATMSGTGITNANGGINILPSEPTLDTRTVNVGGTSTFGSAAGAPLFVMQNGGTLNVKAGAVWNIVNDGEIRNNGGTTPVINNAGTFEKTAGTQTTNIGAVFNNNTGGTLAGNSGTLSLNGGGSGVGGYSVGAGAKLGFGGGTADLNSGATVTGAGTVVVSGGAVVNFNSGAKISAALETDGGTTTLATGHTDTVAALTLNGGTLTGTSTLTVTGLTTWGSATMSGTGVTNANGGINMPPSQPTLDTRTVNVGGTSLFGTTGSPLFVMQNGGTLNVQAGAEWNIVSDGEMRNNGGTTPVINNAGTFEKTAGTETTNIGAAFNNNTGGTVAANSGTLSLNGGGSGVAGYSAGSGARLVFGGGTFALNSGTTISGMGTVAFNATVNLNSGAKISAAMETDGGTTTLATGHTDKVRALTLNGGALTGTSTLTVTGVTTWGSATMSGTGITNANGGIEIPPSQPTLDTRTVNVGGTSVVGTAAGGPLLVMQNGGTLNVQAGAVWNIVNDGEMRNTGGTVPVINNAGTFEKTAGTGTMNIGVTFNNSGSVIAKSGTLGFAGSFSQTSGSTSLAGGSISGIFGQQAGSFLGKGTITGSLSNAAGLVSPGSSFPAVTTGTLTIGGAGNYAQAAGGTLLLNLGGSASNQIDQLNVSGMASLNGALDLCLINNFQPAVGTKFKVMKYASHNGQFSTVESGWTATYGSTSLTATYNGAAALTFSPENLTYPTLQVGTHKTLSVTLTNSGVQTLTISSITVTGADKAEFTISSNNCGASLTVGSNCKVGVKFAPASAGKRNAQLSVVDNACGVPQVVNLIAAGTNVTLAPSPADFGSEAVGVTSAPVDITLTNHGTKLIKVKSVSITGSDAGDFAIQNNGCASVAAAGSCTITLTFTPQATGTRNATLNVSDSDGGSPQTDALTGSGT